MRAGHATMSAVFEFYTAGYFLWCMYARHRTSVFGTFVERQGWCGMLLKDVGHALALYWILLNVRAFPGTALSHNAALSGVSELPEGYETPVSMSVFCRVALLLPRKARPQNCMQTGGGHWMLSHDGLV